MRQSTTVFVLCIICLATSTVAFGQKNRQLEIKTVSPRATAVRKPQAAVVIETPEAFTDGNGVYVRWRTTQETDNLGFYVIRVEKGSNEFVDNHFITGSAIGSRHETLYAQEYSLFDATGTPQSQYVVESFELNGKRTTTSPVFPSFVASLSEIAGASSQNLLSRSSSKTGYVRSNDLVYSKDVQSAVDDGQQLADPVNQLWVAAQPGAKIGVRQTGMYRVSRAQLVAAGFDVNADVNLWQLYSDGVEQAIIVDPSGNYVDFYGKSIDTIESDTRMYYLVVGPQPGRRMANVGLRPNSSTVKAPNYTTSVSVKERTQYIVDLLNGAAENYYGHLFGNFVSTTNVNLSAVDATATTARVTVRVLGYSAGSHVVNLMLNGHSIGQMTGNGIGVPLSLDVFVPASYLVEGTNALDMTTTTDTDYGFFDQVQISYQRRHVADQNRVSFTTQNIRGANLTGFSSSNVRIFDITYDGSPTQLTGATILPNGSLFDVAVPAYRPRVMYAVEDTGLLSPVSVTFNSPSSLSTSNHNANLVIISYKDFMTQANAWADYRRGQGTSVEVINVEDIFDEFNYGVLSANSMKDFLNFARQNWQTAPHYVLLIGDGSYDPRNYEGNGFWDLVPAKLFDSDFEEDPSDDAIVDFNNDGLAEMAIGRIPARNAGMVTNALNKTMAFEANIAPQNISRGFTCHYDNPIGWDFQGMCQQMADQFPAGTTTVQIPRADTNPNAALITELNNGRFFVNFSGHGTTGSWASGNNFAISHVPLLTNINNLSVYTMLTCLNGYFIGQNVSLGEGLLNSTNGGAVAAWVSSGRTTPDVQQVMGVHFFGQVAAGQITRLGDLIIDAKTVVPGGSDIRLSWVLLGDPMLKTR
jgi:hypothetical protein